jgi:hypothetical protein
LWTNTMRTLSQLRHRRTAPGDNSASASGASWLSPGMTFSGIVPTGIIPISCAA